MSKFVELTGQNFGKLAILGKGKYYISPSGKTKEIQWRVRCKECGIEYDIKKANLLKVKNQSCDKHINRFNDLIRKRYGKLTVIKKDEKYYIAPKSKKKSVRWICKCDCGTTVSVIGDHLKARTIVQCTKCQYKSYSLNGYISNRYLDRIKDGAKKRNIYFDKKIDKKYLWNLFLKQNKKCALSGISIHFAETVRKEASNKGTTASLDRIDSSKEYIKNNIQWLHKDINRMKWEFNQKEFIQNCKDVWRNNNEKN